MWIKIHSLPKGYGYNAMTGQFVTLVEVGIVDPIKVVRVALQNAAFIAGLVLTTVCLVCEILEPKTGAGVAGDTEKMY